MPTRNCPKCGNTLKSTDCYFCSNCGSKLEDSYIRPFSVAKVIKYKAPQKKLTHKLNKAVKGLGGAASSPLARKNIFLSIVAVLLTVNVISLILLYIYPLENFKKDTVVEEKTAPNLIRAGLNVPAKRFDTAILGSYVPSGASVYLESTDYGYFVDEYFLSNTPFAENLNLSKELMDGGFAVFALKVDGIWEAGAVFTPKDADVLNQSLGELKASHLSFEVIEGRLIIATNPKVTEMVKETQQKLNLNVTQTPAFVTANTPLEREGVVKVVFLDSQAKELAASVAYYVPSLKPLLDQLINSGYNEFVVL